MTVLSSTPVAVPGAATGRWLVRTTGRLLLHAALAIGVVLFLFLAVGPRVLPYQTVTMLTGSMRPGIPTGSVAVEWSEPVTALRAGQVISFHAPVPRHPVVTHRVVGVRRVGGRVLVRTRGDANAGVDPWVGVVHGARVWRVRAVVPYLGTALRWLRAPSMRLVGVWLAPAILLCWFLAGVWRRPEGGHSRCDSVPAGAYPCSPPSASSVPAPPPSRSSRAPRQLISR